MVSFPETCRSPLFVLHFLVDGYKRSKKYLIIQQPQREMASRFWKVVVANKISHILFLNKLRVSSYSAK
jgi:protein tyrosine phosphatase